MNGNVSLTNISLNSYKTLKNNAGENNEKKNSTCPKLYIFRSKKCRSFIHSIPIKFIVKHIEHLPCPSFV